VMLNSIADTTTHRDRDGVHCAIVELLLDFLDAESVAIYSLVDESCSTTQPWKALRSRSIDCARRLRHSSFRKWAG